MMNDLKFGTTVYVVVDSSVTDGDGAFPSMAFPSEKAALDYMEQVAKHAEGPEVAMQTMKFDNPVELPPLSGSPAQVKPQDSPEGNPPGAH